MKAFFTLRSRPFDGEPFDMTPVIDVVFLLIIFFMLVCQFITAERFKVDVPDAITSAAPSQRDRMLTVTILPQPDGAAAYAVGAERLTIDDATHLPALIASAIDDHFRNAPHGVNIVRLRGDKSVDFGAVRPVLQGIAQSAATDIDWAVRE